MSSIWRDRILESTMLLCAAVSAGVLLLILVFVFREAWPALQQLGISGLTTGSSWSPLSGAFNLVPLLVGTLAAAVGSTLLTGPLGVGIALFLRFYAPSPLAFAGRRLLEIMAGVPSVVYGLWGLTVLVPAIEQLSPLSQGQSLLAGILILTAMTLPTVAISADAAIAAKSHPAIASAAALGLNRRCVAWSVILPAALPGILSGVMLQLTRAIGETLAVLMVCGNIVQLPESLFSPVRTLTANIALEMGYADQQHRSALFACGCVLLILVMLTLQAGVVWKQLRQSWLARQAAKRQLGDDHGA